MAPLPLAYAGIFNSHRGDSETPREETVSGLATMDRQAKVGDAGISFNSSGSDDSGS